jgi:phage tail tape-measure protein
MSNTPIVDACDADIRTGFERMRECARDLERMCEELAQVIEGAITDRIGGETISAALAKYQAMKDEAVK